MSTAQIRFFREITAPLIEGVVIIDRRGLILVSNQAVTDLFGYSETDLVGKNVNILMPAEYAPHHNSYIDRYNRTNEARILGVGRNAEGQHCDGSIFPVNLKVKKIEFENTPYYMGVIHSLQRQQKAADTLKFHTELLERAEAIAHLGHWRVDLVKNQLFWSKEIYRIHGVTPDTYTPDVESALDFYHPDDRKIVSKLLDQAIESDEDFTFEARILNTSGQTVYVRSSGESTRDKHGNAISVFGVFLDISKMKQTELALIKANEELEEFAYRTSHDLRSPLVSSASLIALSKKEIANKNFEHASQCLDLVEHSLTDLDTLVQDILTLTQAQKQDEDLESINVRDMISNAIQKMSHIENFNRLDVQIELNKDLVLKTQPNRFNLIIENLISNAIKYQNTQEENSYLNITAWTKNNFFILEVTDNGLGVPEEYHSKLFEMFKRFHTRVAHGSGLGLYMVKKSAELLGGEIGFLPRAKGSKFRLLLPLSSDEKV